MSSTHFGLVLLGVVVHLILLYSIFDIYYASPLVHGTLPQPITNGNGLAKRLVIFSADGLRSDVFFQHSDKTPFLHNIIRNGLGCWGISTSHVPTESRPGHVALLAGFYEDVSAVASGWKQNPVPFDSIINRSRNAWAWGSPDIVSIFTKGIKHASSYSYPANLEDFASSDAAQLDRWVFDKVQEFISVRGDERTFHKGNVFFLHLLGIDTNGHGFKPHSKQYIENLKVVDEGIASIVELFGSVFGDNETAFIFVSDHGMTDWGSHGAGTDAEVLTPFVAWGSGVKRVPWKMTISQVDTVPFMAALLGSAIPMNNVGTLPYECLKASAKYIFQASFANLKQMLVQFNIKRMEIKARSFSFFFQEFELLSPKKVEEIQNEIRKYADRGRYEAAAFTCLHWIPHVRAGLLYFHHYERSALGVATTASYFFWSLLLFMYGLRGNHLSGKVSVFLPSRLGVYALVGAFLFLVLLRLPFSFNIYFLLPVYLASVALNLFESTRQKSGYKEVLTKSIEALLLTPVAESCFNFLKVAVIASLCCFTLGIFTAVFTNRSLLSFLLILLAFWPFMQQEISGFLKTWYRLWFVLCLLLAAFPQLPPVGRSPSPVLCVLSPLIFAFALIYLSTHRSFALMSRQFRLHAGIHLFDALVLIIVDYWGSSIKPIIPLLQLFCWTSLPMAFILPNFSSNMAVGRLISWFSSLFIPYSLLSLSYESAFLLLFFVLLSLYVRLNFAHLSDTQFLEIPLSVNKDSRKEIKDDGLDSPALWFRAVIVVVFIEIGFFGTGNIASLNSFNPSFLRCFLSVFSPFTMTTLLIFKISIPFLSMAFALTVVLGAVKANAIRLSLILLIITDAMATVFFFRLVDDGSWLEIGMSISHYVISMLTSVIVFLLLQFAQLMFPLIFTSFPSKKEGLL